MENTSDNSLLPYQPIWAKRFEDEKRMLKDIFSDTALDIEHIGSTSIEGLISKPITDIVVMIKDYNDASAFAEPLAKIGYAIGPSSTERDYYLKNDPTAFHLSIAFADRGGFWPRQILFRNYLRAHSDIRDEYAQLKTKLLQADPSGINTYIEGKTAFIYKILHLAEWEEGQTYKDRVTG